MSCVEDSSLPGDRVGGSLAEGAREFRGQEPFRDEAALLHRRFWVP